MEKIKPKVDNLFVLVTFSLLIALVIWWCTPQRIVNESEELAKENAELKQKVYHFEHPEEHTVHYGRLGVRRLTAFGIGSDLYYAFPDGEHYRYPLELKCGCSDCKCSEPAYLVVGVEYKPDLSDQMVEVRVMKKDKPNYYELLRTRPDLDSLQVSTTAQQ